MREIAWHGKTIEVEPLPWYYEIIQIAREWKLPPWEMLDRKTPREFWLEAMLIVSGAEAAARQTKEDRAKALANTSQQQR